MKRKKVSELKVGSMKMLKDFERRLIVLVRGRPL